MWLNISENAACRVLVYLSIVKSALHDCYLGLIWKAAESFSPRAFLTEFFFLFLE